MDQLKSLGESAGLGDVVEQLQDIAKDGRLFILRLGLMAEHFRHERREHGQNEGAAYVISGLL